MKNKLIILINSILILFSVVSCLKIPNEKDGKEIIIPDENFDTNTQDINVPYEVSITFSNGQTIVNNPFEGQGISVHVDKQNVTVISNTLDIEANYVLSGNTSNGFVKIYSDLRFGLLLNGVSILNPTGAAINIQSGKRVSVTLVDYTNNRLVDGGTFQMTDEERMDGTFHSQGQLIVNGAGSLLIYANDGHAIGVRDYMQINNGNITVNNATSDGIHCRDYIEMNGGKVVINAKSDGIESTNQYIIVKGGTLIIKSGNRGLKSAGNLTIAGGKIEIESLDDGIYAVNNVVINGGEIYNNSDKNAIVSTEGAIALTGGLLVTSGKKNVFDCVKTFSITGGTAIGTGVATVIPDASASRQRTVVWGASKFTAGQLIYIKSSNNAEVLTFKFPRAYSGNMTLVYTSPLLQANTNYTIYKDGAVSGGSEFHGLYSEAVSNGGTVAVTFTTSTVVTSVGKVSGL